MANILELVIQGDDQASKVLEGIQGKIQGMSKGLKVAGVAMTAAGTAIIGTMALSIKSFAEAGDAVQKMALRTGLSTEAISELRYAAELSGTSIEGIDKGIKRMASTLIDAEMGLSTAVDAMDALGMSVDEFKGLSPEEAFNKFMEAIAGIEDPLKRSAIAQDIFGKSGTDLLPMMAGGVEGLIAMREEASELGLVFDQEAADKAASFNDSLTELKGGLEGIKMMIAENVIPILMPLIEKVQEIISRVKEWIDANPELFRAIMLVTGGLSALMLVVGPLLIALPSLASGYMILTGAISAAAGSAWLLVAGIAAIPAIAMAAVIAISELTGNTEKMNRMGQTLWYQNMGDWIIEQIGLNSAIDATTASIEEALNQIKDATEATDLLTQVMEGSKVAIGRATWEADGYTYTMSLFTEAEMEAAKAAGKKVEALKSQGDTLKDTEKITESARLEIERLNESFENMMDRIFYADSEAAKFNITMFDIYDALDKLGWATNEIRVFWDKWGTEIGSVEGALLAMGMTAEEVANIIGNLSDEVEKLTEAQKLTSGISAMSEEEYQAWATEIAKIGAITPAYETIIKGIGRGEVGSGITSYQYGGLVGSTGLAYLHKGETIIPANTTISVPIYLDGELITEKIVKRVGNMARLQGY